MGEPALLFQPGAALIVERALVRKQAFLPAGQKHGVEFQPLGRVQGHNIDGVGLGGLLVVHDQRDVLQKTLQVLELLHGAHELFQVFQPAGGVGGAVLLPHLGIARLSSSTISASWVCGRLSRCLRQRSIESSRPRSAPRGFGFSSSVATMARAACGERHAALAGVIVQELHGGVAQPALRHIDDALEGEIVGRRVDHPQIGERVADFGALVEARAADHAVGQAERDETVLEFAHLERGAHQDGDLVERVGFPIDCALQLLDLLADGAGFFLGVPGAGHGDLLAGHVVGAQRLAEPAFVVGDQVRGGGEDVAGRAVIALEPDHRGAGEIVLEAQDVVDLGAAPAVDRLVVVADAADVFGGGGRLCSRARSPWRGQVGPRQRAGRG